jgi:hypothetical protein
MPASTCVCLLVHMGTPPCAPVLKQQSTHHQLTCMCLLVLLQQVVLGKALVQAALAAAPPGAATRSTWSAVPARHM